MLSIQTLLYALIINEAPTHARSALSHGGRARGGRDRNTRRRSTGGPSNMTSRRRRFGKEEGEKRVETQLGGSHRGRARPCLRKCRRRDVLVLENVLSRMYWRMRFEIANVFVFFRKLFRRADVYGCLQSSRDLGAVFFYYISLSRIGRVSPFTDMNIVPSSLDAVRIVEENVSSPASAEISRDIGRRLDA